MPRNGHCPLAALALARAGSGAAAKKGLAAKLSSDAVKGTLIIGTEAGVIAGAGAYAANVGELRKKDAEVRRKEAERKRRFRERVEKDGKP